MRAYMRPPLSSHAFKVRTEKDKQDTGSAVVDPGKSECVYMSESEWKTYQGDNLHEAPKGEEDGEQHDGRFANARALMEACLAMRLCDEWFVLRRIGDGNNRGEEVERGPRQTDRMRQRDESCCKTKTSRK